MVEGKRPQVVKKRLNGAAANSADLMIHECEMRKTDTYEIVPGGALPRPTRTCEDVQEHGDRTGGSRGMSWWRREENKEVKKGTLDARFDAKQYHVISVSSQSSRHFELRSNCI